MAETVKTNPPIDDVIKGLLELIDSPDTRRRILIRATVELKDRAAVYPEEGRWNRQPGTRGDNRWYQRLYGPRWLKADGFYGGKNTSQELQRNWKTDNGEGDWYQASVYTEVTYAPFLFDPEKRVHWAASHGWLTTDEVEEDYSLRFEKIILDEIDKKIDEQE